MPPARYRRNQRYHNTRPCHFKHLHQTRMETCPCIRNVSSVTASADHEFKLIRICRVRCRPNFAKRQAGQTLRQDATEPSTGCAGRVRSHRPRTRANPSGCASTAAPHRPTPKPSATHQHRTECVPFGQRRPGAYRPTIAADPARPAAIGAGAAPTNGKPVGHGSIDHGRPRGPVWLPRCNAGNTGNTAGGYHDTRS